MLIRNQESLRLHAGESVPRRRRQTVRVLELGSKAVPVMIDDIVLMVLMID